MLKPFKPIPANPTAVFPRPSLIRSSLFSQSRRSINATMKGGDFKLFPYNPNLPTGLHNNT